jgi:thiol-disulfide isomerase/thioredoxin
VSNRPTPRSSPGALLLTVLALCSLVLASSPALADTKKKAAAAADAKADPKAEAKPDPKATEPKPEAHAAEPLPPPVLKIGDDAPIFNGLLHNAAEAGVEHVDLSSLVGSDAEEPGVKLVLVSFFATWCGPCKKELPFLVKLSRANKEKGLRVISVAIDKEESKWPQITELVAQHKIDFPVVKDRYNLIARRYLGDKTPLPSVFLIGRDGLVKLVKQGYPKDAAEFLEAEVATQLGGAQ